MRAALAASGPRYIVFRVNGVIANKSRMALGNPFCTIFGQSAPGIVCLGGPNQIGEALFISTHDVIVRYLTFDGSNKNLPPGPDNGSVGFELASGAVSNVIFDHCSMRWWSNKGWILYSNGLPITNVTTQFCLAYEPNVGHPVGYMTDANSHANLCTDLDFHHNLIVNHGHRLPLYNTKQGRWVSNITFNYDYFALLAQGGVWMDIIGNKNIFGNLNVGNTNPHPFGFSAIQSTDDPTNSMPGPGSFFLQGNYCPAYQTNPAGDQTVMCARLNGEGTPEVGPPPASWFRTTPLTMEKYPIISQDLSANLASLDNFLLPTVGNSQQVQADGTFLLNRDSQDARIVAQYKALGPGQQFNFQFSTPSYPAGTPYVSSLHDGIADAWKQKFGLSTTDPTLYNKISPNSGLPYIECFQNGVTP